MHVWPGSSVTQGFLSKIEPAWSAKMLKAGVVGLWMPNNTSANTLSIVGGKPSAWDKNADPKDHTEPLSWSDSLKYGHYLLDDKGRLLPEIEEIFRMAHDRNAAIFFGHPTKPEFRAMAEYSQKIGFKKGVVDHPFSPFVNLTIEEMKDAAAAGLWLNFTFDELSPLLGIDPANMYKAIRTVGPRALHALVGCRRAAVSQLSGVAPSAARLHVGFRLHSADEIYTMSTLNPAFIVGLNLSRRHNGRARRTSGRRTAMRPYAGPRALSPAVGPDRRCEKLLRYPVATRNTKYKATR